MSLSHSAMERASYRDCAVHQRQRARVLRQVSAGTRFRTKESRPPSSFWTFVSGETCLGRNLSREKRGSGETWLGRNVAREKLVSTETRLSGIPMIPKFHSPKQ